MKNDGFFYNKLNKIRNYNYVFYFYMFVHNLFYYRYYKFTIRMYVVIIDYYLSRMYSKYTLFALLKSVSIR